MKTKFVMICLLLSVLSGALLFNTSQKVQHRETTLAKIKSDITREEQSIKVLKAEWAWLNQPDRLEKLAAEHLPNLTPVTGDHIVALNEIPYTTEEMQKPQVEIKPKAPLLSSIAPRIEKREIPAKATVATVPTTVTTPQQNVLNKGAESAPRTQFVFDRRGPGAFDMRGPGAFDMRGPGAFDMRVPVAPVVTPKETPRPSVGTDRGFSNLMQSLGVR